MTARKPDVLCVALRNVLQRSRLEGKDPGRGHHAAAVRAARRVQRRLDEAPLPRAVRELLRDVVQTHEDACGGDVKGSDMSTLAARSRAIVARARKVRK